jgi:hypothetical protein
VRAAAVAKTIMVLRNIGSTPSDATASIRLKTQSGRCTEVWTNGLNKNRYPLHSVLREIQELIAVTWPI